jgi:N-acetylmuramic acid 6-phosphate etherase
VRADVVICPVVGPEALTGSTRMKAGTATKLVLNTLTTAAMVRLGKVYENLMVDLRATNVKLRDRAERIDCAAAAVRRARARTLLEKSHGQAKTAILMHACRLDFEQARRRLKAAAGSLRQAMALRDGRG